MEFNKKNIKLLNKRLDEAIKRNYVNGFAYVTEASCDYDLEDDGEAYGIDINISFGNYIEDGGYNFNESVVISADIGENIDNIVGRFLAFADKRT